MGRKRVNSDPKIEEEATKKKQQPDTEEQVAQLFGAQPVSGHDMHQKKLCFKIANLLKDGQNKCTIDSMWSRFLQMNDRETCRSGTNEPLVNNKQELISIVESLERDNLVMYAAEENQVILM